MPIQSVPNTIEVGDFTGGLYLGADESGVPFNSLLGANNLLLDKATGNVVIREGFARLFETAGLEGYRIYAMHPWTSKNGDVHIVAILSNNQTMVDNIRVMVHKVGTSSWTKVSPTIQWNSNNGRHWGTAVDGFYYGGGENDPMYRINWDGASYTWISDVGTATFNAYGGAVRPTTYAFQNGDIVQYAYTLDGIARTENFEFFFDDDKNRSDGIRYPKWENVENDYDKGERVSRKISGIWQTFIAIKDHEPTVLNRPGDGTAPISSKPDGWRKNWRRLLAPPPVNEDGRLNRKYWKRVPIAPKTELALWHGNRLFARADQLSSQTLVYSRVAKMGDPDYGIGKDKLVGVAGNPQWEPDDWRTGGAPGAGFIPFETEQGDNITGLTSLGYYLMVFKRYHTFVIAGLNPETWTTRELTTGEDSVGCVYKTGACTHEGLGYFISDRGFYYTDGTQVKPVPGQDKVSKWIRDSIDWDGAHNDINLFSFDGFVWISLPTGVGKVPDRVLLYHPPTESFWKFDMGLQSACIQRFQGTDRLYFSNVAQTDPATTGANYDWGTWNGAVFTVDNTGDKSAKHSRQSRRTIGAVEEDNRFVNPSFEAEFGEDNPLWAETTYSRVDESRSVSATRWGKHGCHLSNLRRKGSIIGLYGGWEGLVQTFADKNTGTNRMSVMVRRPHWRRHPDWKPALKFIHGSNQLPVEVWTQLGRGWWQAEVSYVGSTTPVKHGFIIPPNRDVHLDMAMSRAGALQGSYFDGDAGEASLYEGSRTGTRPYIMRYGDVSTDDTSLDDATSEDIAWSFKSAWFAFGAGVHEERRVRRIWALIRGDDITASIRSFLNFNSVSVESVKQTTTSEEEVVVYAEGQLPPDGHAYQIEIEGNKAPAGVLGIGVETEPRRIRFGS